MPAAVASLGPCWRCGRSPAGAAALTEGDALRAALPFALERDELRLHYQPIVDLQAGTVLSVEALLRRQRQATLLPPASFLPHAEQSGLIGPIGRWVLERVCRDLVAWTTADPGLADLSVAVDVSRVQVCDRGLVAAVRAALDGSGLAPHRLTLQLTETALSGDDVGETGRQIAALGVHLGHRRAPGHPYARPVPREAVVDVLRAVGARGRPAPGGEDAVRTALEASLAATGLSAAAVLVRDDAGHRPLAAVSTDGATPYVSWRGRLPAVLHDIGIDDVSLARRGGPLEALFPHPVLTLACRPVGPDAVLVAAARDRVPLGRVGRDALRRAVATLGPLVPGALPAAGSSALARSWPPGPTGAPPGHALPPDLDAIAAMPPPTASSGRRA